MKTRMARGIATVALFGAVVIGGVVGSGSASAASLDPSGQSMIAGNANQTVTVTAPGLLPLHRTDASKDDEASILKLRLRSAGFELGRTPATKGGRFP